MAEILVVDDQRRFAKPITAPITYARSSSDAIALLEKNKRRGYAQVWLDHDLGEDDDIRPVVQWLIDNRIQIGQVYVQSMNPVGVDHVVKSLEPYYKVMKVNHPLLRIPDEML